ncbi:MAG: hypothetical protein HW387_1276 [Parachlamydiales bacterium]|nr:hypothetical protein [Parachlamydiales bacterium]
MTTALRELLNDTNFSYRLDEAKKVLDHAQASVTFWGTRVVRVKGDNTSVTLDKLAKKVVQAASQRLSLKDLTLKDRITGLDITNTLRKFYKMTDHQIAQSCFFTWLLAHIREFSMAVSTTRKHIEGFRPDGIYLAGCSEDFRFYGKSDYKKQFGYDLPEHDEKSEQSDGYSEIIIKETVIRDLWEKSHINTGTD